MNPSLNLNNEIVFNGSFESGNLDCVIKVKPLEFDLFLRIDANTRGHTAWYFFSIKNATQSTVTLNICNLKKTSPLYTNGMTPYVFSRRSFEREGRGWEQRCFNCQIELAKLRYSIVYDKL